MTRPAPSEAQIQATIVEAARLRGWLVYHTHDSRRSTEGFPDLILGRGKQVFALELKAENGRVSHAQEMWLERLNGATVIAELVRPSELDTVLEWLV